MQRNKIQIFFRRFLVVLALLCFVGMTGYSELLHDHDYDFSESHDDCAPCNWTKLHKVDKNEKTYIAHVFSFRDISFQRPLLKSENLLSGFNNRGPPLVS